MEYGWQRRNVRSREVVWHDARVTVYLARGKERLTAEGGHVILAINTHAESVYQLVRCWPLQCRSLCCA